MSEKNVLLVEGRDDEHVVKSICGYFKFGNIERINTMEGIDRLLESIPVWLKPNMNISVLGIIVDADDDAKARWQSIANHLRKAGYHAVDESPDENGAIVMPLDDSQPKVGIWLMPDNHGKGYLEDFLRRLIKQNDSLHHYAENVVAALPQTRFKEIHRSKAIMHSWLAWQEDPGKPFGQSITAHYLDLDNPLGKTFVRWLRQLFFE